MRTTIEIPDSLFRQTKSRAALQGVTMKQFIIAAIEQADERFQKQPSQETSKPAVRKFPAFHLRSRGKLDLSGFNFDDLLA